MRNVETAKYLHKKMHQPYLAHNYAVTQLRSYVVTLGVCDVWHDCEVKMRLMGKL